MVPLLDMLRLGLTTTLLDVDNALYMTSAIDPLPAEKQKKAIFWGLVIEFFARIVLVIIFGYLASGTKVLFEIFGIEFTAETLSLLVAGIFLLIRSTRDLFRFFLGAEQEEPAPDQNQDQDQGKSFTRLLIEMSLVNALLSVDTVIALTGSALGSGAAFAVILYLLLFSAVVRLFFVRQIAQFIKRYPATNIIILTFLSLVGLELITLGLGGHLPELLFSALMLLALLVAILYQLRYVAPVSQEQLAVDKEGH
jgi:predicted tellurium resistance membrane protein TerC